MIQPEQYFDDVQVALKIGGSNVLYAARGAQGHLGDAVTAGLAAVSLLVRFALVITAGWDERGIKDQPAHSVAGTFDLRSIGLAETERELLRKAFKLGGATVTYVVTDGPEHFHVFWPPTQARRFAVAVTSALNVSHLPGVGA